MERTIISWIEKHTGLKNQSIRATLQLLNSGATIPFIARYRKELTHSLDETEIRAIEKSQNEIKTLIQRKESIQKSIEEQGKWTAELAEKINDCWDAQHLEDLYLPYKRKRKTKADTARSNGLEGLAKFILSQQGGTSLEQRAAQYLNDNVVDVESALEGARHIIAEWMNEDLQVRNRLRRRYERSAVISSKVIASKKTEAQQYKDYWEFSESLQRIPSHRLLAIRRGESEGLLRVQINIDTDEALDIIERKFVKKHHPTAEQIIEAGKDAWSRLLSPSLENEFAKISKSKADLEAIEVFSNNLRQLLLEPPLGQRATLAIDPGFRTGCKVAVLNKNGQFGEYQTIFPHPPQMQKANAEKTIITLIERHGVEAIAIGNGTAGRETEDFVNHAIAQLKHRPEVYLISEAGASIYSASEIAREEFPDLDLTVRGAISIGRRLMDPLAELVKIDAKSIGVGQYQHDVHQVALREALDHQVISCVNQVGINVNTASAPLLSYVSGIGPVLAKNIVAYRDENGDFTNRKELKKVKGLGAKAYEQAAGFLRIKNGSQPLDDSAIHPERYDFIKQIAQSHQTSIDNIVGNEAIIQQIDWKKYQSPELGMPTLKDIAQELKKPGLDPRGKAEVFSFSQSIRQINDLYEGLVLPGIVTNLTKFGAFVDIGIKENGLVHVSQITNRFIKDPAEVLHLGQKVEVGVQSIDLERKRIQLTMKDLTK
ncbi:Tex family protein [Membranihabitans marinus]|uniref:Tex family protein n=1 Tax=Membranihabitans marinus TaxID=1227546 RepID=UPI001F3ACEFD|nr:Tex family protein [Membranihabitans marinus]